jgi:hypothetical protein
MNRYLPVAAAVVLIGFTAVVQGIWTERWGEFPELEIYASRLKDVPMQIGDWIGEEVPETPTSRRILDYAGAVGSLARNYRNDRNQQVQVFIVCGRFDDVFAHTPDRCYPAAGFESGGDITQYSVEIGSEVAEFKTSTYLKSEPSGNQNLRIYWTFNANGPWIAPEQHRLEFAGARAIYKLYVVVPSSGGEIPVDRNAAIDFIHLLIPELNEVFEPAFTAEAKMEAKSEAKPESPDASEAKKPGDTASKEEK